MASAEYYTSVICNTKETLKLRSVNDLNVLNNIKSRASMYNRSS